LVYPTSPVLLTKTWATRKAIPFLFSTLDSKCGFHIFQRKAHVEKRGKTKTRKKRGKTKKKEKKRLRPCETPHKTSFAVFSCLFCCQDKKKQTGLRKS